MEWLLVHKEPWADIYMCYAFVYIKRYLTGVTADVSTSPVRIL